MSHRPEHFERGGGLAFRALIRVILVLPATLFPSGLHAQAEITAFVESTGRVVFTNMAAAPPVSDPGRDLRLSTVGNTPYADLIETISRRHSVDPTLVRAVIEVESAYDPHAVSSKNARGLMQLIPETGRRYGVRDFFNPQQNIEGGVRYLRFLLDKFDGDTDLTLAAYNSGENRVERLGRIPNIPETVNYVRKVRAAVTRMRAVSPNPVTTSRIPSDPDASAVAVGPAADQSRQGDAGGSTAAEGSKPASSPIAGTINTDGVRTFSNLNGF